jgi:hypothetical protein
LRRRQRRGRPCWTRTHGTIRSAINVEKRYQDHRIRADIEQTSAGAQPRDRRASEKDQVRDHKRRVRRRRITESATGDGRLPHPESGDDLLER